MLTDTDLGIKKFILGRLSQIYDEVVNEEPEYLRACARDNWGNAPMNY